PVHLGRLSLEVALAHYAAFSVHGHLAGDEYQARRIHREPGRVHADRLTVGQRRQHLGSHAASQQPRGSHRSGRARRGDRAGAFRYTSQPPSIVRHCPVMLRDSSLQRNSTALATSSAVVTRRSAISCTYSSYTCSGVHPRFCAFSRQRRSMRSPATMPGATQLTLIPCGPTSSATVRVKPRTAHFEDEYAARSLYPRRPDVPAMFTILPPRSRSLARPPS